MSTFPESLTAVSTFSNKYFFDNSIVKKWKNFPTLDMGEIIFFCAIFLQQVLLKEKLLRWEML